jgi:biotin-dependent carboxylase-like uncharacterized protein
MSVLRVISPGMMLTVQDSGRYHYLSSGVSASGPIDAAAFALANALVGNAPGEAGLEFASVGGQFEVDAPVRIAVTGGRIEISVDGRAMPAWESFWLQPGQTLAIGAMVHAVWGYVAISGGIQTRPVLGARSTHLRTGLGGLEGRALKAGDALPLGPSSDTTLLQLAAPFHRSRGPIRVVPGPQDDYFDAQAWDRFLSESFVVSPKRDRMAMILGGAQISAYRGHDIVSDAIAQGAIQVPASGHPIVLMAERQTTGGYPKIATLASVDIARLAQLTTGTEFRFARIDRDQAEDLLIKERQALRDLMSGLRPLAEASA